VRLGRARHHRRIPLPGRLCCDPARSTSTCCRSHEASAGGPSCACVNRYFHDRADDGHIGLPAAVPSRQSHTREPTVPSGTARKSQIAITASPIRPHQNLQIPITSHLCPAGSCLGGFRTPAPCLSLDLRGPASENLHQVGRLADPADVSEPDIPERGFITEGGRRSFRTHLSCDVTLSSGANEWRRKECHQPWPTSVAEAHQGKRNVPHALRRKPPLEFRPSG